MLAVKLRALLLAEISLPSRAWLSVARAELHPAAHTELAAISGPRERADHASQKYYTRIPGLSKSEIVSFRLINLSAINRCFAFHECLILSYSGLLQSLVVLLVPPPQDLEQTL